jgi:hypothetical protein
LSVSFKKPPPPGAIVVACVLQFSGGDDDVDMLADSLSIIPRFDYAPWFQATISFKSHLNSGFVYLYSS